MIFNVRVKRQIITRCVRFNAIPVRVFSFPEDQINFNGDRSVSSQHEASIIHSIQGPDQLHCIALASTYITILFGVI